ncbi:MAG: hypothetical protein BWK79_02140, partial [Beggiatoa sp. IS2]
MNISNLNILLKISKFLLLIISLGFTINSDAQDISLFLNKTAFVPNERLELAVAADGSQIAVTHADVYLAVQFPDGSLYYLSDLESIFFEERNKIAPIVSAWPVKTIPKITLLSLEIPKRLPSGVYKWYLTLVAPGARVEQPANWLANTRIELVLSGGSGEFNFAGEDEEVSLAKPESALDSASEEMTEAGGATAIPTSPSVSVPPPPAGTTTGGKGASDSSDGISAPSASLPVECCFDDDFWIPPPDEQIPIQSGILTAGDVDDNLNPIAFQRYLDRQLKNNVSLPFVDTKERVTLKIVDSQGQGFSNARIKVTSAGTSTALLDSYAGTDGRFYLYPHFDVIKPTQLDLQVSPPEDVLGSPSTV